MDIDDAAWLALAEKLEGTVNNDASERPNDFHPNDADWLALTDESEEATSDPSSSYPAAAIDTFGLKDKLRQYYGYSDFRGDQEQVILEALYGRDVSIFWSTGSGKSLCYLLPSLVTGKVTIVISPLISLMQDQTRTFNNTVGQGTHELAGS